MGIYQMKMKFKMKFKALFFAVLFVLCGIAVTAKGEIEIMPVSREREYLSRLDEAIQNSEGDLKNHLQTLRSKRGEKSADKSIVNAVRIADELKRNGLKKNDFVHFSVPAMSEWQRLPQEYPQDGTFNGRVSIIAAGDEYEPGSFVIYPLRDLGKVRVTLSALKNSTGKIFPAADLDLKVVKVWYQNANGWFSYFGDTGLKLTPELLLNDEELIKVDTVKKGNYARIVKEGKTTYQWITPEQPLDSRYDEHWSDISVFSPMAPGFDDARTLQKISLEAGQFKQLFLTAHTTKETQPGIYHGEIILTSGNGKRLGAIPVSLRVLPFVLPQPKCYFDLNRDYVTFSYSYISLPLIMRENGGNYELAKKQFIATMKNQEAHNQHYHMSRNYMEELELMKAAGRRLDKLFLFARIVNGAHNEMQMKVNAASARRQLRQLSPETLEIYLGYGDEPDSEWLMDTRRIFEIYQNAGFRFFLAGSSNLFFKTGYQLDFVNLAFAPESPAPPQPWNLVGHANVAWYADHHIGTENPAFNRRQYGLAPYLANYSATGNYAHHYGPYNDRRDTYKPMVFAYGVYSGVIDTLAWEGYREGVDDIRYATKLKMLAQDLIRTEKQENVYAGRQALQFLALLDSSSCDLNAARLEMINYILRFQQLLGLK